MNHQASRIHGTFFIAALLMVALASCRRPTIHGEGEIKAEDRNITRYFNRIEISAPVDVQVDVVAGSSGTVSLNGYANILPYIRMKVEDSTLKIYTGKEVRLFTNNNIKAHINIPSLNGLDISGSSDVIVNGNITGEALEIDIAGSGSVKIGALNTHSLDVEMAGSSKIEVQSGHVDSADYEIAGSADIHAFNLQSISTGIEISGAGEAEVAASTKLHLEITGSGDVKYKGNPLVSKEIVGSGSVQQVQ